MKELIIFGLILTFGNTVIGLIAWVIIKVFKLKADPDSQKSDTDSQLPSGPESWY